MNIKSPNWEAIKEILRWVVFYAISWFITQTLMQVTAIPESFQAKIWVFTYTVPLRFLLETALTLFQRYLDKLFFEKDKLNQEYGFKPLNEKPKGILPF